MAMAATALPAFSSRPCFSTPISKIAVYKVKLDYRVNVRCTYKKNISSRVCSIWENFPVRIPLSSYDKYNRLTVNSAAASDTGLEDLKPEISVINDRKITVESREDGKIHVRVDVSGKDTEKTFDDILTKLAKDIGPVPGFKREKGGKTPNVPKIVLLKMLGRSTVRNSVIKELISSTLAAYTTKENLNVKEELTTKESAEELEAAFTPGKKFSFSAVMELEEEEAEKEQEEEQEKEQEEESEKEQEMEAETAS